MKKNVLALSISAALCSLGMVGSAYAITDLGVAGTVGGADKLKANNDGIGHNLIVPYFTAQGKNATAFTLTNTTSIGKAVKIRFRGAENSDDILDFQVFLSPYDVWTASVSAGATATDPAVITTKDRSCTKPSFTWATGATYATPVSFKTTRLSATTNVAGTREGYIEIFNMADLAIGANTVYSAILHNSTTGVPTCSSSGFTFLDTDDIGANYLTAAVGLKLPTTGLVANWIIANVETGQAFSGQAAATQAISTGDGKANTGNLVYWPQMSSAVVLPAGQSIQGLTADPILGGNGAVATIAATMQDLPDMSTPYISGLAIAGNAFAANGALSYNANAPWAAKAQASQLTAALAAVNVNNEFFADTTYVGATDWVFTMPTRRYNVAVVYTATPARSYTNYTTTDTAVLGTFVGALGANATNYFDSTNTALSGNVICVTGVTATAYNREEGTALLSSSTSFSPSTVAPGVQFCGEAGVWALGQSATTVAATGSAVLQSLIGGVTQAVPINSYTEGWLAVQTPGLATKGLPVVGASFSKAQGPGAKNYGWGSPHTVGRIGAYVY